MEAAGGYRQKIDGPQIWKKGWPTEKDSHHFMRTNTMTFKEAEDLSSEMMGALTACWMNPEDRP